MGRSSASTSDSRSSARSPALDHIYHQHLIDLIQLPVYATLTLVEVLNMEVDDVADGVVEHVEAGGLFDHVGRLGHVDQVEDGCQYLIHALHVLYFRVELGVDVEDASHVVVPVGLSLLLLAAQELLVSQLVVPVDQFELLPTGTGQVWNHDIAARHGEEGELGMRAGRILLNLFPQHVVLLKLLVPGVVFLQNKRIIGEFRLGQEHLHQSLISIGLTFNVLFPQVFLRRQIFEYQFPTILAYVGGLVRYALGQAFFESLHVDDTGVEDIDEIDNFFADDWRHSVGREPVAFGKRLQFGCRNGGGLGWCFGGGHLKAQKIVFHYNAC